MMLRTLIVSLAAAAALTGCSQTSRYVTNKTWFGQDELHVATSEVTGNVLFQSWTARVISCQHQPDHSLMCVDQQELNQYLNAENTEK